jgi:hypothetical protein
MENISLEEGIAFAKRQSIADNYYNRRAAEKAASEYNAESLKEPMTMYTEEGQLVKMLHMKTPFSNQPDSVYVQLPNGRSPVDENGDPLVFSNVFEAESYLRDTLEMNLFDEHKQAVDTQLMWNRHNEELRKQAEFEEEQRKGFQKGGFSLDTHNKIKAIAEELPFELEIDANRKVINDFRQAMQNLILAGVPEGVAPMMVLRSYEEIESVLKDFDMEESTPTDKPYWKRIAEFFSRKDRGADEDRSEFITKEMLRQIDLYSKGRALEYEELQQLAGGPAREDDSDFDIDAELEASGVPTKGLGGGTATEERPSAEIGRAHV